MTPTPPASGGLHPDRVLPADPGVRALARELYDGVRDLPIVAPHGHVPPALLADPDARFGTPADFFIVPDHYVFRMLYSQGVPMEALGVPTRDGTAVETDPRAIWRTFCAHFHLFRGTPTGLWIRAELRDLFGVDDAPTAENADRLYDVVEAALASDAFRPRALFERFGVEVLATTDAASDDLTPHARLQADGLPVVPTFRPDAAMHLHAPGWREEVDRLSAAAGVPIDDLDGFRTALATRRTQFRARGARASDHGIAQPHVEPLDPADARAIFGRGLAGTATEADGAAFHAHMLFEMAGMALDDGLAMQLHVGSFRNHHASVFDRFGLDKGADIPVAVDWTRGLHTLLNAYGREPGFRLIPFTLDEATYARELAPLAGHYPALRLGAPWWFFDSVLGMERYLDRTVETAGIYNLAGFNDDTRAFASIPTRHDVWRRAVAAWLAGLQARHLIDDADAPAMARWLAYDAAKAAYGFGEAADGA